ncbi:MAG TPA: hypothetical protein VN697_03525 [Tepidiformaceae bacterium]|jgi:hypothetical protein|nr:hypothetical protein [Tepidiformaceae bacterium]
MAAINHPLGGARRGLPIPSPFGGINWWIVGAIIIVAVSAMLPVLQNSTATSEGFNAQRSRADEAQLQGQVSVLEADVAQLTSLSRIERRAQEIGLHPTSNPIYVHVDVAGPEPAKIPSSYLPPVVAKPLPPAPWWRSIVDWLP